MHRNDHAVRLRLTHHRGQRRIIIPVFFQHCRIFAVDRSIAFMAVDIPDLGPVQTGENGGNQFSVDTDRRFAEQRVRTGVRFIQHHGNLFPELPERLRPQMRLGKIDIGNFHIPGVGDAHDRRLSFRGDRLRGKAVEPQFPARHAGARGDRRIDRIDRFPDQAADPVHRILAEPLVGGEDLIADFAFRNGLPIFLRREIAAGAAVEFRGMPFAETFGIRGKTADVIVAQEETRMFLRQIGDGLENVFPVTGIERTETHLAAFQVDGPHPLFFVLVDTRPMAENALDQHAGFDLAPQQGAAEFAVAFDQEFRFFPGGESFRMERERIQGDIDPRLCFEFDDILRLQFLLAGVAGDDVVKTEIILSFHVF